MDTLLIRNGTVVNAEDGTMVQADILSEGSGIRKASRGSATGRSARSMRQAVM